MALSGDAVRAWYAERLREYHGRRFAGYLSDEEADEPQERELGPDAVRAERAALPAAAQEAYDLYKTRVEAEDWGSARAYRVPVPGGLTFAVRVNTDGDDGYLEVYGDDGTFLGAGRTYIELVAWDTAEAIRAGIGGDYPPHLDTSLTLWKPPAPQAQEAPYQNGDRVDCRYNFSFVRFRGRVTDYRDRRVEVLFDDGLREWVDPDHVQKVYVEDAPPADPPMALAVGDRVEYRWQGGDTWFPAVVKELHGSRVLVEHVLGDQEWTSAAMCRPVTVEPWVDEPPKVGERVECRWRGTSERQQVTVVEVDGERVVVRYDDEDQEETTLGMCRRLAD